MYWNYLERHPNHALLPPNAEQEARDALAWFHLGMRTSLSGALPGSHTISDNLRSGSRSTVPFSKQECEDLLSAISRINCEPHSLIYPTISLTRPFSRFWGQLARTNSLPQLDFEGGLYVRRLALFLLRTYLDLMTRQGVSV